MNLISNNQTQVPAATPENLIELKVQLKSYLSQYSKHKLVIILDSLENICPEDNALKLDWLPKYLSNNCKLILTVAAESEDLIKRLKRKYINETNFLSINGIDSCQAEEMMQKQLRLNNYRLEEKQLELIRNLHKRKLIYPLHFKLMTEEYLTWKSSYQLNECVLKDTLNLSVAYYLHNLEGRFGKSLVRHILCKTFQFMLQLFIVINSKN